MRFGCDGGVVIMMRGGDDDGSTEITNRRWDGGIPRIGDRNIHQRWDLCSDTN